jgi:hypothetical protein
VPLAGTIGKVVVGPSMTGASDEAGADLGSGHVLDQAARHRGRLLGAGERVLRQRGQIEAGAADRGRLARRGGGELGGRAAGRLDDLGDLVLGRRLEVQQVAQGLRLVGHRALVGVGDGGDGRRGHRSRLRHRRQDVEQVVVLVRGGHRGDFSRRRGGDGRGRLFHRLFHRGSATGGLLRRVGEHVVEHRGVVGSGPRACGRRWRRRFRDRDLRRRGRLFLLGQGRRALVDQLLDPRRLRVHLLAQSRLRGLGEGVE